MKNAGKMVIGAVLGMLALSAPAVRAASVTIDWDANTESDLAGYRLFYATTSLQSMTTAQAMSDGTVTKVTLPLPPPPATGTSTTINLADGATFYFRLTAYNNSGQQSAFCTNPLEISTFTVLSPASVPGGFTATPVSMTQIDLTWTYSGATPSGFHVDRALDAGFTSGVVSNDLVSSARSLSATGLTLGTQYFFRVRAENAAGNSAFVTTTATTPTSPPVPSVPGGVSASAVSSSQINLAWTYSGPTPSGFYIDWSLSPGGATTRITLNNPLARSYSQTSLPAATPYYYRIRAFIGATVSNGSAQVAATTQLPGGGNPGGTSVIPVTQKFLSPNRDGNNDFIDFGASARDVLVLSAAGHEVFHGEASGPTGILWNGSDTGGMTAPTGFYIGRVKTDDGKTRYEKILLVK